jgi:hypothetical protein
MAAGAGRIRRRRPSGALVVAIGAVVLAVVGTAIADPLASTSKLTKKEKKQVRSLATGVVDGLAGSLSVANANTAGSAGTAQQATNASNAENAANAATLDGQDSSAFLQADSVIRVPTQQLLDDGSVSAVDLPNVDLDLECQIDEAGQDVVSASVSFASAGSVAFGGLVEVGFAGDAFPIFQQAHPAAGDDRMNQSQVSIVSDEGTSLTGTIWAAFNMLGGSDHCFVGGHLVASD